MRNETDSVAHAVKLGDATHEAHRGESVLDTLLRVGVAVPHACRAGACQSCLMRTADDTAPPAAAQVGLRADLSEQGYFLACQWVPDGDVTVQMPAEDVRRPARLVSKSLFTPSVLRAMVAVEWDDGQNPFTCKPGQYVTLTTEISGEVVSRSYSVAGIASTECRIELELHVRRVAGGRMSSWLFDEADAESTLWLQGPAGDCFYRPDIADKTLLLAGTGTGLAPLWGVLHSAIAARHRGRIIVLHGARTPSGHYLADELRALAVQSQGRIDYVRCAMEADSDGGPCADVVFEDLPVLTLRHLTSRDSTECYICGDPTLVAALRRKVFLAGVPLRQTHCDAFLPAATDEKSARA